MVSHMQVPAGQGKQDAFIQGKRKWGGCSDQRVRGFSLAESSPVLSIWAPKSLQMVIAAMKLKDAYSLEGQL